MLSIRRSVFSTFSLLSIAQTSLLAFLISFTSIIVEFNGVPLSIGSLLIPVIAGLYLIVARNYTHSVQLQYLHVGLLCLYLFPLSVYFLISLPTASPLENNAVYQMLFNNLPHKFFASTLAYLLSFYVPLLGKKYAPAYLLPFYHPHIRALGGGLLFFLLQSLFLTSELKQSQAHVIPSVMLVILLLSLFSSCTPRRLTPQAVDSLIPDYLANATLIIVLACMACEYRLMRFDTYYLLTASGVLFPLAIMGFNVFSECYRTRDVYILIALLVAGPLLFDCLSLLLVASSEARYSALETWYQLFMPRRMVASALALLLTWLTNVGILHVCRAFWGSRFTSLRIYLANSLSNSFLCVSNYALLYGGIFAYDEIWGLVINNWCYKMLICLLLLPLTCHLIRSLRPHAAIPEGFVPIV